MSSEFELDALDCEMPIEDRRFESRERRQNDRRAGLHNEKQEVLSALLEISNYVGSLMALDDILTGIVGVTSRLMDAQSCSIYLWDAEHTHLIMRCTLGLDQSLVGKAAFELRQGISGHVARTGELINLADATSDPRYAPLPTVANLDLRAYLCAPLRIQDDIIGVMVLRKQAIHEFTRDEVTTYETICKQVAIVIEKSRLYFARLEAEKLAAVAVSLSGVAHYIKNLLLSMRGGEYLIETGLKRQDSQMTGEGWGVLKRSTSKIRDLVENMLNFYRETEINPRPVEINTFILEVLQNLEDRAMEKHTVLTPDLDLRLEKVELDPDTFQDVMINLITNALDAIPDNHKGIVKVRTRLDEKTRQFLISVLDNGSGISEEDKSKLFNLFFSTKGKKGTGIGLAASKRIIQDHNGAIEVQSEPGKGAEFIVRLPLTQPRLSD